MVKRINKRVHIEKNQLLLYQGGVMTMLIMGTGVVYSPSLVLLDTQILYLPGDREDKESSESKLSTVCFPLPDMVYLSKFFWKISSFFTHMNCSSMEYEVSDSSFVSDKNIR